MKDHHTYDRLEQQILACRDELELPYDTEAGWTALEKQRRSDRPASGPSILSLYKYWPQIAAACFLLISGIWIGRQGPQTDTATAAWNEVQTHYKAELQAQSKKLEKYNLDATVLQEYDSIEKQLHDLRAEYVSASDDEKELILNNMAYLFQMHIDLIDRVAERHHTALVENE